MDLFKTYKPPKPLDVTKTAAQIGQQNTANAYQNTAFKNPDLENIWGNKQTWQQTGVDERGNPTFASTQQLGGTGQQFSGGLANLGNDYFTGAQHFLNDRPDMGSMAGFDKANQLWSSINEPRLEQARAAMENRLRNQGFDPSSEGYKNAMSDLALQQDQARQQFQLGAQGQMFNQGQQDWQNQISQFQGLTQPGVQYGYGAATNQGGFQNASGAPVENTNIGALTMANQAQQQAAYEAQMKNQAAQWGAVGNIAGAAFGIPGVGSALTGGLANLWKPKTGPGGYDSSGQAIG